MFVYRVEIKKIEKVTALTEAPMSTNLNVYIIKIAANGHLEDSVNNCYPALNTIEN